MLLKKLTIYFLCLTALLIVACMDYSTKESINKPPEWTKKSYWKDNQNFYAVGVHSGHFVNEQDAYFSALRELAHFLDIYSSGIKKDGTEDTAELELAGTIKCTTLKKEYKETRQDVPDSPTSVNDDLSEEYISEYKENDDGVKARYYMSASGSGYSMEIKFECSLEDISETLKRIPVTDTYNEKKGGMVTTYALIQYFDDHYKEQANIN